MSSPAELRGFFNRAVAIAARLREAREDFADLKSEDEQNQVDWARLRALAIAHDADEHDDKKKNRVAKLLEHGTYANWYAEILGIGQDEQNAVPRSGLNSPTAGNRTPRRAGTEPAATPPCPQPAPQAADTAGSPIPDAASATADDAVAPPSDDPDDIPTFLRRNPDGSFAFPSAGATAGGT